MKSIYWVMLLLGVLFAFFDKGILLTFTMITAGLDEILSLNNSVDITED